MLGIIARSDRGGGLANQTLALCQMLRPGKVMLIDSTSFNGAAQHPELYDGFNYSIIPGFPTMADIDRWLQGLSVVFTCETFYNQSFIPAAQQRGIRTYNQVNYEFYDGLTNRRAPLPTMHIMPSHWMVEEMRNRYLNVVYLPPPIHTERFHGVRAANLQRRTTKRRFLHVVGKPATKDRNGTETVVRALEHTRADFTLVIKAQQMLDGVTDPRVQYDYTFPFDNTELYRDFDALIYPRRYGGLALPMCEALVSGLPVIMTNISPNNQILPEHWLVPARKVDAFMGRTMIDVYEADALALAQKIDEFCEMNDTELVAQKNLALELGNENYSADILRPRYRELLGL